VKRHVYVRKTRTHDITLASHSNYDTEYLLVSWLQQL